MSSSKQATTSGDASDQAGPDKASQAKPAAKRGGLSPVVLVVDDDPDIRSTLEALLGVARPGVRVVLASSGTDALAHLGHVDLVVTDWRMPGMDGLELARHAREARLPVLMMTAFPDAASQVMPTGFVDELIYKPLDFDDFAKAVGRYI